MNAGFSIYLLFMASWFLHLTSRIPILGSARFDLILVAVILVSIFMGKKREEGSEEITSSETQTVIKFLFLYIGLTLPFVEWPGSVINTGLEKFIKATVFYFFTIYLVTTEERLIKFVTVFIMCQTFRVIEPVYLHLTQDYWGSFASMQNWEYMDRLSGAPNDVVNPNGLAFIVLTILPFYYYLSRVTKINFILSVIFIPVSIYALALTGSRSGAVGLLMVCLGILWKSESKLFLLVMISVGCIVGISYMGENFKDRYVSIYSSESKNAATAEGRIEGTKNDFRVALRRPFFGHGLGTSREANANFGGVDQPSHNLYTEVAQELGFLGLIIFILLIKSILGIHKNTSNILKSGTIHGTDFLSAVNHSMQVWLYMNILFSFASYGLTSYEWYLFAGLSVAMKNILHATPVTTPENMLVNMSKA